MEANCLLFHGILAGLDESVLAKVSLILDPSGKWLELARNLDILDGMESVFRKQSSPTTYLLNNLDVSCHRLGC